MLELTNDHFLALEAAAKLSATPSEISRLGQRFGTELSRWAFTQSALRKEARRKFSGADRMLFTREALEQATRETIATYHASRFPAGSSVCDLTCGIGADLLALAKRGPAYGFDLDAERCAYASHNLRIHSLSAALEVADCLDRDWGDYAFADPGRRGAGRRLSDPSEFQPEPGIVAERMRSMRLGGIKLSPLLEDRYLESLGPEMAFVADGDECPEAVVWCGSEAEPGRYAVWAESGERLFSGSLPPTTLQPGEWLYEAHPAAIRAHCLGALSEAHGLKGLADSNGYLVGDREVRSNWLKPYRVEEILPSDIKRLKARLSELEIGQPILKSRAKIDLTKLAKELKTSGERPGIVAAYPEGKSARYLLLSAPS